MQNYDKNNNFLGNKHPENINITTFTKIRLFLINPRIFITKKLGTVQPKYRYRLIFSGTVQVQNRTVEILKKSTVQVQNSQK